MLAAPACGDAGPASTTAAATSTSAPGPAATPADAVGRWLAAVESGSAGAATSVVDPSQLALFLAVENPLSIAQVADLIRTGVPADVRAAYWSSFEASFLGFAGAGTGGLRVGEAREFAVGRRAFAVVEVGIEDRTASIVATRVGEAWIVDLMASFGPTFVRPLRELLAATGPDADGTTIREAMAESVPSLRAAIERPGVLDLPVDYVLETESLIEVLAPPSG